MSWVSVSPSQRVVWRPLEAIWRRLGICSRPLGAMVGKADAILSRGRRETGGIPTTATATRGLRHRRIWKGRHEGRRGVARSGGGKHLR
jgi:hypothetical protein